MCTLLKERRFMRCTRLRKVILDIEKLSLLFETLLIVHFALLALALKLFVAFFRVVFFLFRTVPILFNIISIRMYSISVSHSVHVLTHTHTCTHIKKISNDSNGCITIQGKFHIRVAFNIAVYVICSILNIYIQRMHSVQFGSVR